MNTKVPKSIKHPDRFLKMVQRIPLLELVIVSHFSGFLVGTAIGSNAIQYMAGAVTGIVCMVIALIIEDKRTRRLFRRGRHTTPTPNRPS